MSLDLNKTQVELEVTRSHAQGSTHSIAVEATWIENVKNLKHSGRAALIAVACSFIAVLIGYDLNLVGSIIANESFIEHFGRYDEGLEAWTLPADYQLAWNLVQFLSAIVGAFTVGLLNDWIGRRPCHYIIIALTMVGTVVELVSPNWKVWIVAKVVFGVAMGFMQGNTPTYISDITPVHIRGFMLSLFQFWILIGVFISSCVLEGTSTVSGQWSWKAAVVSQFGIGAIAVLFFFFLVPESPYYLAAQGRLDGARAALLRIRGKEANYDVDADLALIHSTLEHEKQSDDTRSSYLELVRGSNLRRTCIACLPMVMQQMSGFGLCGNYLAYFLQMAGFERPFLITVIANMLSLFSVLLAFSLIERVGRRNILLSGVAGMLPSLLAVGIAGVINEGSKASVTVIATFCMIWSIFYYMSVGSVGWALVGEIASARLRSKTTSAAAATNAVLSMAWSMGIPYLINQEDANLGAKTAFIFFGTLFILGIVAFFVVPETKGRTFDELDQLFESGVPARKFATKSDMQGASVVSHQ